MNAYDRLTIARSKAAPSRQLYFRYFTDFFELHGDRNYADDKAILGGVARLDGMPVTVIAIEKGVDTKEKKSAAISAQHIQRAIEKLFA